MGKNNATTVDMLDSKGNVTTVDLVGNKEGARITAKREGSRKAQIESRQAAVAQSPTKPRQAMPIQKQPATWADMRTLKDILCNGEELGVTLHGVYKQVESNGERVVYFVLAKKVPKDRTAPEKLFYNQGEYKTVYMMARMTEHGEINLRGHMRDHTLAEIKNVLVGFSQIDGSEIYATDMKNAAKRLDNKDIEVQPAKLLTASK